MSDGANSGAMGPDPYAAYERLRFDRPAARVLRVTLAGSGRMNSVDARMHAELARVWSDIDHDRTVNAVVLRGAEQAFSAGGDFGMIRELIEDHDARMAAWREARDIVYGIVNCSRPVVAGIRGPAVGAGLAAAMMADVTVAGRNARIIDGHTRLGVAAGDHSVMIWPLLIGMAKAKYYLLSCDPLSGEEAERIGLVSMCVDDELVDERALEIATRLAEGPPTAIRFTKHALNNWLRAMGPSFDASLAMEFMGWDGAEVREGLASFEERRPPRFPDDSPV